MSIDTWSVATYTQFIPIDVNSSSSSVSLHLSQHTLNSYPIDVNSIRDDRVSEQRSSRDHGICSGIHSTELRGTGEWIGALCAFTHIKCDNWWYDLHHYHYYHHHYHHVNHHHHHQSHSISHLHSTAPISSSSLLSSIIISIIITIITITITIPDTGIKHTLRCPSPLDSWKDLMHNRPAYSP